MHLHETIFCTTGPTVSTAGPGVISLHDIQTGSALASFKQTNAGPKCTTFVESRHGQGGFILAAQPDKSILNVYNFQKDQLALKFVLPEKLTCIAVDRTGNYCAGATAQGRIYLWEVASGILYNSWDAHYRQVTVLRFTLDGSALLSGSEDSGVSVWSVSSLLDDETKNELPMPYCSLSDHTLPITDIICGVGPFPNCRVLTSSVDHSVKVWDLSSRTLLTTFQFPQPIICLAWDLTERLFFAAAADGSVYQTNLFRKAESNNGGSIIEAIGGAGSNGVIRMNDEDLGVSKKRLISVGNPIASMTISLTSSLLLVGTSNGLIQIYDVASHQLLRTISTHKGFSITGLATMLKPPDLVGHISLSLNVGSAADARDVIPVKPVAPFQRMRDPKTREAHDISIILPARNIIYEEDEYSTEELLKDHAFFIQPSVATSTSVPDSAVLNSRVADLEAEVAHLREQLGKAKGVNDVMWETVVHRVVVGQGKDKNTVMDVDENQPKRKKK